MAAKLPPEVQAIISACDAGYFATAIKLLVPYLEQNSDSQRGWVDYGHALGQLCRYDEAESAFLKAIDLTPAQDRDAIFGELGNLHRNRGDFATAANWYQKQIDAAPDDATGLLFLASLEIKRGNAQHAVQLLSQALTCSLVCLEEVHNALGNAYRNLGEYGKAKSHYQQAIDADPKYTVAKTALSDIKKCVTS